MISVLIPVYNTKPEYLDECLKSVYNQNLSVDYEVIIINNESTDKDTNSYLNSLDKKNTHVYMCQRYPEKKNLSIALNYGLTKCNYEYVARLDSDDIMLQNRLEKQIHYMVSNPQVDILGTQTQNMFGDKHITNHPLHVPQNYYRISTHFINHPSVMFKKISILSLGGYKEFPDHIPEDFVLWVKALKNGMVIHNLPDILMYYRNREGSLSEVDSKHKQWYEAIYQSIMED
jgi:glycosyltransferase involved in cell wall biosynthesis